MTETTKIANNRNKISLVFIHGWGLNSAIWQPIIEALSPEYDIQVIDLPGFGVNVKESLTCYSLTNVCAKIASAILQPSIIIGWSMGGLVATQLALSFPQNVLGLVTIASSPHFVSGENWQGIEAQVLAMFHQQLSIDTQKTIDGFLKIQAMGSPHVRQDIKRIKELVMQYPLPTKKTLDESLALLETVDQRHCLSLIKVPFLRMYGRLDGLVPKAVIPQIADLCHASEQVIFERASHAPFISHADDFLIALKTWLAKYFIP